MSGVDRNSPVPLYFQLKQILLSKIESGEWKPGDLIPGELDISESYGLSRTTVRQTLGELVSDGQLTRHRGRGTFVAAGKRRKSTPPANVGLHEALTMQGQKPGWEVLEHGWLDKSQDLEEARLDEVYKQLKVPENAAIYRVLRVRLANGEPLGWQEAYLPDNIARRINTQLFSKGESKSYLLHLPEMTHGQATRTIEAVSATEEDAKYLKIDEGSPMLMVQRVVTVNSFPVEYLCARYPGDRFKYQTSGKL